MFRFDSIIAKNKFKKQVISKKPESELYMSNIKSHARIITFNKIHSITWTQCFYSVNEYLRKKNSCWIINNWLSLLNLYNTLMFKFLLFYLPTEPQSGWAKLLYQPSYRCFSLWPYICSRNKNLLLVILHSLRFTFTRFLFFVRTYKHKLNNSNCILFV